jgi:hypothetical protein
MEYFDVSRDWTLLASSRPAAAQKAAADLARIFALLRAREGLPAKSIIVDASGDAPGGGVPIITLNAGTGKNFENGFSWRLGADRLEIHGDSGRGLCNGVYNFLAALGVRWPCPGQEEFPPVPARKGAYPLKAARVYRPADTDAAKRRRLVITKKTPPKSREQAAVWAIRNRIDALALPLEDRGSPPAGLIETVKDYGMILEAGGWELSLLVPRKKFFFHRDVFRMESGKRVRLFNFCPTNPETTAIIRQEAERFFRQRPEAGVFHLWPDRGRELAWCSCPTCRAFSREEQNRIAVNTAADVLAEIAPESRISYYENTDEAAGILPRPNMFALKRLPGEAGAEDEGLYAL